MNKKTILALCLSAVFLMACSSKEQREFKSALKIAQSGDATAQMKVGDLYLSGTGTEQNIEQSVHWYKAAADQGTTVAFAWLMTQAYQGNSHADQVIRKMQQDGNIFLAHWVLDLAKKNS
ncbi:MULTISPECIES: SEL1-like repeat protein [unclassified Acinetobacter]|uniref:SEL1-like repeat protein n=1 Tax=unclassified Acinetobacter TaxID=196816 RepID=UPI0015D1E15D|nr:MULTISPECIES: SEL1-like repeat protein [unclassified Acinetobacter]